MCLGKGPFRHILNEKVQFTRNKDKDVLAYNGLEVSVLECLNCTFAFCSPLPALADFFAKKYNVEHYGNIYGIQSKEKINQDIVSKIKQNHSSKGNWLDIGANRGDLLDLANKEEFDTYGVEVSGCLADNSNHKTNESSAFEFLSSTELSFNVVTLIDVLEHLESPREVLNLVNEKLMPGGIVFIKVPHYRWQSLKQSIAKRLGLNNYNLTEELDHINHFTPNSLIKGLADTGFEILDCGITRSEQFTKRSLFNIWKNFFREIVYYSGACLNWLFGVYLGFNFYVIAKKGEGN